MLLPEKDFPSDLTSQQMKGIPQPLDNVLLVFL